MSEQQGGVEQEDIADSSAETASEAQQTGPRNLEEAMATMSEQQLRQLRLAKVGAVHFAIWLVAVSLFAAADSWRMLSDLGVASLLAVLTGVAAGFFTTNFLHEWSHLIGAWRSGGTYDIPEKVGGFVYDWNFEKNSTAQFMTMSKAGTVGGAIAVVAVWWLLPTDTLARSAVLAGAIGSFAFAARIEWPVLRAVSAGGDPLAELSKIDEKVLRTSVFIAVAAGLITLGLVAP